MSIIVVYHDNCHDGVTAAAIIKMHYESRGEEIELYPGRYEYPPDIKRIQDKQVIMCDFSWKLPDMINVAVASNFLLVLDHHQSAEKELQNFERDPLVDPDFCKVIFDMNRSGAGMAWDHFHPGEPRPLLVDAVEDRDLWRFKLPLTRELHTASNAYPLDVDTRIQLLKSYSTPEQVKTFADSGVAILRYHDKLVQGAAKYRPRATIAGYNVPCVACPIIEIVSDLGQELCKGEPFAATYTLKDDGTLLYSLRSDDAGVDVSEVARTLGGGGHKHAAGFSVPDGMKLLCR